MRYLLDKVTARYTLQAIIKLSGKLKPTSGELSAVDFFSRYVTKDTLYIVPPTYNILMRIRQNSRHKATIDLFLTQVEVAHATKYYKRWARRLREYTFTREDASVLALATFGTDEDGSFISMDSVITFDQHMINNWSANQIKIQRRLETMKKDLTNPYSHVLMPRVLQPELSNDLNTSSQK